MSRPVLHLGVRDEPGASRPAVPRDRLAGAADGLLDATVVLLATWTVVYHVSLLLGIRSTPALLVEAAVLVAVGAAWWTARTRGTGAAPPDRTDRAADLDADPDQTAAGPVGLHDRVALVTLVAAGVCAVAVAADLPWLVVWPAWLVAGVAGTTWAFRSLSSDPPHDSAGDPAGNPAPGAISRLERWVVLGSAGGLAVFSLVVLRPNPDDLFYVNWSQWVAAHGEFPLRDTLYSDLGYPMANWPPIASYDGLVGAVAHLVRTSAGNVVYLAVPPVATVLAVLALWRLLRAWRLDHRTVALLAALAFLLVDGTSSYATPGNLFATRLWQGKVILACVLVPVLLVHLLRYAERPVRSRLGFLFLCGAAGVALSTSAIFVVPVVAAAGVAPLVRARPAAAIRAFAATAVYPVAAGVVTLALHGRSADDFGMRRQYRFDPAWFGHEIFLSGVIALLGVGAVLLGALLVPHPAARVGTGVSVVLVGLTFVPGLTRLSYETIGLGPTLWRLSWALVTAALVGAAASWVTRRLPGRRAALAAGAAGAAAVLALSVLGSPIWAEDTASSFAVPPHWQRGQASRAAASWLIDQARSGGTVLAPNSVSITVAVTTTGVKVVAPRDYYLDYLSGDPSFHHDQRLYLWRVANADPTVDPGEVAPALALLDVRAACLYRDDHVGAHALLAAGYQRGFLSGTYRCFRV